MATQEEIEDFLAHHGIKGMHWGVRKNRDESGVKKSPADHAKLKKAALIGGTVAGVALIAAGAYYLSKHGDLPISSLSNSEKVAGEKTVENLIKPSDEELTRIVHATGHKYQADKPRTLGGLSDPISELEKAGLAGKYGVPDLEPGQMRRYGKNLE